MAKKNKEYWQGRFEQLEKASHQDAMVTYSNIEKSFYEAQREIENKINSWYTRFANNNQITIQDAKRLLNSQELKEFKWDVQDYIKYGHENEMNELWMKELENASARYHISRLEALKIQTQQSMEVLFGNELDEVDKLTRNSYTNSYFRTMFEMQKGFNVGFDVANIDDKKLSKIVNKPWVIDERNFSERIWGNKTKLINELHNELTRMCLTGKSPDSTIKYLSKKFNTSKAQAGNLVMTENAYFSQLAQKDCFKSLDVEQYEIVATLDTHTSEICREQDGKVYDMKDYQPGVTAPPFHNYCRSTTVPYFDDDFKLEGERAARDEDGKTYYVSDKMKYEDWYKKYVQEIPQNGEKLKKSPKSGIIKREYQNDLSVKFGKEHYDGMHDLIDKCENNNLSKVWEKYESDIKVGDAQFKEHEHCSGSTIYVNGEHDRKGTSWQSPFQVSFHESGHAIDSLAANKGTGVGLHYSSKYKNGIFPQTIKDEVQELVNKQAEILKEAFKQHKNDYDWLYQNNFISKFNYDFYKQYGTWIGGEPKYSKNMAYNSLQKEIQQLQPKEKSDLSDILEGATNGKITCGFGHGSSYWKSRIYGGVSDGLATEAFAEMVDSTFTNPESLAAIKKYLPKSYAIFEEMIENLL